MLSKLCRLIAETVNQMTEKIRTYSELILLPTFKERFEYLSLNGVVGDETFGSTRYFNQKFYRSEKWRRIRNQVILRDNGCDLGIEDYEIGGRIIIHHMNPISLSDIEKQSDWLLNPEYLICVCNNTHQAIHYGSFDLLPKPPTERRANDTCPWRK